MNKYALRLSLAWVLALALVILGVMQAMGQTGTTLRGAEVAAPSLAPGMYRELPDGPPMQRDYVQQPPLIPHKVDGYEVTINFNKCMDCHSWARHRSANATKISLTHFKDRDANELSNVAPRRYFCMQCHVPITDARPLVENTFQPATGVR